MKSLMMTNSTRSFFLDDPWEAIQQPCYPEGRRLYLNDERFWVSMDENRHRLFFVQDLGGEEIRPLENLVGLDVSINRQANGDHRLVCRLTGAEPDLTEKFSIVAKDIAFHCSGFKGSRLFQKTQERIKSWADFLKPSRSGLTHSEFVGLFGELYVLSELMMPAISPGASVRAWIGPEGKKQDFTLDNWAIEVKATMSGERQTVAITSLDQLDRITNKLYLMRVVASPASDGFGLSLGELYRRCVAAIQDDIALEGLFLQKASALYGKASDSQIKSQYKIIGVSVFDVGKNFPCLTRRVAPAAIVDARYDISVGALSEFEVFSDLKEMLRNE